MLGDQKKLAAGGSEHRVRAVRGVVGADDRQQTLRMLGQRRVNVRGRHRRTSHPKAQPGGSASRGQLATVDRVHVILLVGTEVRATACSDASGTMLRLLEDDGGQQPYQRVVAAKLVVAGLHRCLAGCATAMLDLTDVLGRITDPNSKASQRQAMRGAQATQLGAQPRSSTRRGVKRRRRTAAPARRSRV